MKKRNRRILSLTMSWILTLSILLSGLSPAFAEGEFNLVSEITPDISQGDNSNKEETVPEVTTDTSIKEETVSDVTTDTSIKEDTVSDVTTDTSIKEETVPEVTTDTSIKAETVPEVTTDTSIKAESMLEVTTDASIEAQMMTTMTPDTTWYNDTDTKFTLTTVQQMYGFAKLVNDGNTFAGKTIKLDGDLDLTQLSVEGGGESEKIQWTPIGTSAKQFKGSFDGNEHQVTIYINKSDQDYQGLFGYVDSAEIKAVTVKGQITGRKSVGGIIGYINYVKNKSKGTSIINCTNYCNITATSQVGGIVGSAANARKSDTKNNSPHNMITCKNYGIISAEDYIGGIVGKAGDYCLYDSCENQGTILGTKENVGGIVGTGGSVNSFKDCMNTAKVKGSNSVGGIVGYFLENSGGMILKNCKNTENITGENQVGGMVGYADNVSDMDINKCDNEGKISGKLYVGGMVGSAIESSGSIRWSVATGNLDGESYVGGLIGRGTGEVYLQDSYVSADITGENNYIGGLAGFLFSNSSKNCFCYNGNSTRGVTGRQNVSMLHSGLPSAPNLYYLSDTLSNGSAKSTNEFKKNVVLNLLQKNADTSLGNYWKQGEFFPEITTENAQTSLYKVSLSNRMPGESETNKKNSVKLAEPKDAEYTVYGTTGAAYTYVPKDTELTLDVTLAEGFKVTFYPSDAVTVTTKEAIEKENQEDSKEDGQTEGGEENKADAGVQSIYSIKVGSTDVAVEYFFSKDVKESDVAWYNEENTEFTISTEADLRGLAELVNQGNDFQGKKISLEKDIELTEGLFVPIGIDVNRPFNGTFDGCSHAVRGLMASYKLDDGTNLRNTALFGFTEKDAVIRNLTVEGKVDGWIYSAGVVAYNRGKISKVTSKVSVSAFWNLLYGEYYAGGISGYSEGVITDCTNEGNLTAEGNLGAVKPEGSDKRVDTKGYFGGIVGYSKGSISDSTNHGAITGEWINPFAGGVAGTTQTEDAVVSRSVNTGEVHFIDPLEGSSITQLSVGGVVGWSKAIIGQCKNSGRIYGHSTAGGSSGRVGGICGAAAGRILESVNTETGSVYGSGPINVIAGGISGYSMYTGMVENSYNLGSVQFKGGMHSYAGGLIGQYVPAQNKSNVAVINSYNAGTVDGTIGTDSGGGAVVGYDVNEAEKTALAHYYNTYYLDSLGLKAVKNEEKSGVTSRSDGDMKKRAFAEELGTAFVVVEKNYPRLQWEEHTSAADEYVIFNYNQSSFYKLGHEEGVIDYEESDTSLDVALEKDGKITPPKNPEKEYFRFLGWYENLSDVLPFDFSKEVTSGTILYAKWELLECNVTFDYGGYKDQEGNTEKTEILKVKEKISPPGLEREGYELLGWFLKDDKGDFDLVPYDFTRKLTGDLKLYARWQEIQSDYAWYKPEEKDLYLSTVGDLFTFTRLVNGTAPETVTTGGAVDFAGVTVHLKNDIDMKDYQWSTPIGMVSRESEALSKPFRGIFDGNNKEIKDITMVGYDNLGLFGYLDGSTIKDFTISGKAQGRDYVGAVAASVSGAAFENVSNKVNVKGSSYVGGIAGYCKNNATFQDCVNFSDVTAEDGSYAGGIIGYASYQTNTNAFINIENNGKITGVDQIGGIAGYLTTEDDRDPIILLKNCSNTAKVEASGSHAGGVVGYGNGQQRRICFNFQSCQNEGSISAKGLYAGGIAGRMGELQTNEHVIGNLSDCKNKGNISADTYVGGICGWLQSESETRYSTIIRCENEGNIVANGKESSESAKIPLAVAGGIVAQIGQYGRVSELSNSGSISSNCDGGGIIGVVRDYSRCSALKNSGAVSGKKKVGGIAGTLIFPSEFQNVSNEGTVLGKSNVGGIAGYFQATNETVIENCSNFGKVTLAEQAETGSSVAGVFGFLSQNHANIRKCYNTGNVTGGENVCYAGGIAGYSSDSKASFSITDCYNRGQIKVAHAESYAGGIVGHCISSEGSQYTPIINTYNTGFIIGTSKDRLGAILGDKENNKVSDSYYLDNCVKVGDESVVPADSKYSTEKSATVFQFGELSYILDKGDAAVRKGLWSQDEEYPVFADEKNPLVYKASVSIKGEDKGKVFYKPSSSDQYWYIKAGDKATVIIEEGSGNVLRLISAKDTAGNKLGSASSASMDEDKVFTFVMPARGISIMAEFIPEVKVSHEVTFISEGNTYRTLTVAPNKAAVLPTPPTKVSSDGDDYVFYGWYTEPELTNLYDFNTVVTENITLYAKFKVARLVDVSFDLNYPEATGVPKNQEVKQGKPINEPTVPTRAPKLADGVEVVKYEFLGWYTERNMEKGIKWNFEKDVVPLDIKDGVMMLYAQWKEIDLLKEKDIFEISNLSTLNQLAENVNNGEDYKGKTFILTEDIVLDESWKGIGTKDHPFNGTVDGKGHSIDISKIKAVSNVRLYGKRAELQHSIFYEIGKEGVVEDLTVKGEMNFFSGGITNINRGTIKRCRITLKTGMYFILSDGSPQHDPSDVDATPKLGGVARLNYGTIQSCEATVNFVFATQAFGGFAGGNEGEISNCTLKKGSELIGWRSFGGICGINNKGKILNCKTESGCTLQGYLINGMSDSCGGLVGQSQGGEIENCNNYANVSGARFKASDGSYDGYRGEEFGGIVGIIYSGVVNDCNNYGNISDVQRRVGGIAGFLSGTVKNCHNFGEVSQGSGQSNSLNSGFGGILGVGDYAEIEECTNSRTISGSDSVGGIAGIVVTGTNNISKCKNEGEVKGTLNYTGGIIGNGSMTPLTIRECINEGSITGKIYVGGVVGGIQEQGEILDCYSTGDINGAVYAGGIIGFNGSKKGIQNCMYYNTTSTKTLEPISGGNGASREVWNKCYFVGGKNDTSGAGTGMSVAAFTSGEVAYLLDVYEGKKEHNNIWTQGEEHPVYGKPSYYQVKVSVEGETGHGSAEISKDGAAYQTTSLYMPLKESVYYLAKISADKTETKNPVTGATTTVSYSLGGITLKYEDGSPDEELSGKDLASNIILSGDVELVAKIVKKEETIQPELKPEPEPEPEQKPEKTSGGRGNGKGNGKGNGTGDGVGDGTGTVGDGPGTGAFGEGSGSGFQGDGTGGTTGAGNIISPVASISAPGNGEPEGAMGESSQGGGSPDGTGEPDEMKSPIEKKPDSVYTVADQVAAVLKNPIVLALTVISISAIFAASIFLSYRKRKRI